MELQTRVEISSLNDKISYDSKIVFLGSCFASEIGGIMSSLKFNTLQNPFGALYNPASIASSLKRLSSGQPFTEEDIIESQGRFVTFYHHSSHSSSTKEGLVEELNSKLLLDSQSFEGADWIVVSLGTVWVYRHIEKGGIVSNCHKIPAKEFQREFLEISEIEELLGKCIQLRGEKDVAFGNRKTKWIFTVSPIRHKKDGFHNNQLSKAQLLLAVDTLCKRYDNVFYFPAYEILLDELRDYRFYAEDMIHPSNQAVRYIWERFVDFAIDKSAAEKMKEAERENKRNNHRIIGQ